VQQQGVRFRLHLHHPAPDHPFQGDIFISFVRVFPKLQNLNILFCPQNTSCVSRNFRHGIPNNEGTWRDAHDNDAKVPDNFFRLFALQRLLQCAELMQVMFYPAIVYSRYLNGDCRAAKTLRRFGTWLHEGF
jgi:hypothetical protein